MAKRPRKKEKAEKAQEMTSEVEMIGRFISMKIGEVTRKCIMIPDGDERVENGEEVQDFKFYDWETKKLIDPWKNELCEEVYEETVKH